MEQIDSIRLREYQAEFAKRQRQQFIAALFYFPAILYLTFNRELAPHIPVSLQNILLFVSSGLIIFGFIFSLTKWRCPKCNRYFRKQLNPQFCNNCGLQLKS